MPDTTKKRLSSKTQKCVGCGAGMVYDPATRELKCTQCGSHRHFDKVNTVRKHKLSDADNVSTRQWSQTEKVLKCTSCGAEVILHSHEISQKCPYCGSFYVTDTEQLPGMAPDAVVPFAFDTGDARQKFIDAVKHKVFVPTRFKKDLPHCDISGIYFPCFVFDADTQTDFRGIIEKNISRPTPHTIDGRVQYETVSVKQHISGHCNMDFRDLLVESSHRIDYAQLQSILPYNMADSYSFDSRFLNGYVVEHFADPMKHCYQVAKDDMHSAIKKRILSKYDYDEVLSLRLDTSYANEMYSYRLLPMYNVAFQYKDKQYNAIMNGQTGKVGKGLPISAGKIATAILVPLGIILALILIICMFN